MNSVLAEKRLLSLISMGRPATNHAEPKNLERAINFLLDNAADGLRLVLVSDRAMCGSCQLLVDQLAWLIRLGRFTVDGRAATDIQVLTAHGAIMRADGTPHLTSVNALTGLNLPHAVRFLEIIYNRIDPALRANYLTDGTGNDAIFQSGIISIDFINWFEGKFNVYFDNYFYWDINANQIRLTQTGIETCFNYDEYDQNSDNLNSDKIWLAFYYYLLIK